MERYRYQAYPENTSETKRQINLLMNSPYLKETMKQRGATWAIQPSEARDLDIAFIDKKGQPGNKIASLPALGLPNCIGIKIAPEENRSSIMETLRRVEGNPVYEEIKMRFQGTNLIDHDIVSVMTKSDLINWVAFYNQIYEEGISKRINKRSLVGLSGLERTSFTYRRRLINGFENILLEKESYFQSSEIEIIRNRGTLDYLFHDKKGNLTAVPFHHLREARLDNQILKKFISHQPGNVIGAVVKGVAENERETWSRAKQLEEEISKELGVENGRIIVISGGQLSLFEKWGLDKPLNPALPDCSLNLREVMDFLFLGEGSDMPGVLALQNKNFSLTRNFTSYGADVIFEKRNEIGERKYVSIDNVISLDLKSWEKGQVDFTPMDNVAGIVCVPNEYTKAQIAERLKEVKSYLNRINIGPEFNLLPLNSILFEQWRAVGDIVYEDTAEEWTEKRSSYRFFINGPRDGSSSELKLFPLGPTIGSARMLLTTKNSNRIINYPIDWGSTYAHISMADKQIIGRQTATGLRKMFRNGELPLVPGLYYEPYLLMTAKHWPSVDNVHFNDVAASYLRAEITKRIKFEDAVNVLGIDRANNIYEVGARDIKRWYGENEIENSKSLYSHSHKDHSGMGAFTKGPLVSSWTTAALLLATSNHATNWFDNVAYQSRIDLPKKGSSYVKEVREMDTVFYSNQEVILGENTKAKFYFTNHSVVGSVAMGLTSGQGKILYSGDIMPGPATDKALESIAKDDYNTFLWECTNPKWSQKPSVVIKENMVVSSFEKIMRQYPEHLIVVAVPPNHTTRLESILKAIDGSGLKRSVYVGLKHADILNHLKKALTTAPLDATGRDLVIPEPGEDVGVYTKPAVVLRPWQRAVKSLAAGKKIGIIGQGELNQIRGDSVLVLNPFEFPEPSFGGAGVSSKVVYIYSAPYPYEAEAKRRVARIKYEVESRGGKFIADFNVKGDGGIVIPAVQNQIGFHASGHGDFEENMQMLEVVLGNNSTAKKTVYFTHGEKPNIYVRDAAEWFRAKGMTNINFVGTFNHYNPLNPIKNSGHTIKIQD